jgi:16S rRNA (adenine1518-N6/adenine1519-N6)-dimethyltransferase
LQNNYKHKKNFGQHFLHDENVLQNIFIRINNEAKNYDIIEVGAGAGALTRLIYTLKKNRKIMVEIDNDLVEKLSNTFPENELIHKDVLQLNLSEISKNAILVGNFPYNISSQIVFKMIASRSTIHTMVGMFQKEMAKRICAVLAIKIME